jgi:chemotaxis signal transduction protein
VTDWVQVRVAEERYVIDVAHALEVDARGEVTRVPERRPRSSAYRTCAAGCCP